MTRKQDRKLKYLRIWDDARLYIRGIDNNEIVVAHATDVTTLYDMAEQTVVTRHHLLQKEFEIYHKYYLHEDQ